MSLLDVLHVCAASGESMFVKSAHSETMSGAEVTAMRKSRSSDTHLSVHGNLLPIHIHTSGGPQTITDSRKAPRPEIS